MGAGKPLGLEQFHEEIRFVRNITGVDDLFARLGRTISAFTTLNAEADARRTTDVYAAPQHSYTTHQAETDAVWAGQPNSEA